MFLIEIYEIANTLHASRNILLSQTQFYFG